MNKEQLKQVIQGTYCHEKSHLFTIWNKLVDDLKVSIHPLASELGLFYCWPVTTKQELSQFSDDYIRNHFPTFEKFLKDGNKLQVDDWVLEDNATVWRIEECYADNWNVQDASDADRYVIYAQCWFDDYDKTEKEPEFDSAGVDAGPKSHPYANMIKAKAENMDLVVMFYNTDIGEWEEREWYEMDVVFPSFSKGTDYFLCLPKHKAAVLHSLNGGDVGIIVDGRSSLAYTGSTWCAGCWYMDESCESRIKQEEAKRQPKEGELWMCEYRGHKRALFSMGDGWCTTQIKTDGAEVFMDGAHDVKPLYPLVRGE